MVGIRSRRSARVHPSKPAQGRHARAGGLGLRIETQLMARHQHEAAGVGGFTQLVNGRGRHAYRFFDEGVHARL